MVISENVKNFVMHVSCLSLESKITIHFAQKAQIALLLVKKVTVLIKYVDLAKVFFKKISQNVAKAN